MTFAELNAANHQRMLEVWPWGQRQTPGQWFLDAAREMGELAGAIQPQDGSPLMEEAVGDEIADVVLYLDLLAARCGLSLEECIRIKFNRLSSEVGNDIRLT